MSKPLNDTRLEPNELQLRRRQNHLWLPDHLCDCLAQVSKETDESGFIAGGSCCSEAFGGRDVKSHGLRCKLTHKRRAGECLHSHCGGPCAINWEVPRSKWCEVCETAMATLRGSGEGS